MIKDGKIDISGAGIVKPHVFNEGNEGNEISDEEREYIENLNDTKTVNVEEAIKSNTEENVQIDFLKEEFSTNFTSSKSKQSTSKIETEQVKDDFNGKNDDEIKQTIAQAEIDATKAMDPSTFSEIAGFIIFLIDTGFSTGMKIWTSDSSDEPYSLSKGKQEVLKKQLTMILIKYQARFKIEFMFIATIIVLYIPGIFRARQNKKLIDKIRATPEPVVQKKERPKPEIPKFVAEVYKPEETKTQEATFLERLPNNEHAQEKSELEKSVEEIQQKITGVPKRKYVSKKIRSSGRYKKI